MTKKTNRLIPEHVIKNISDLYGAKGVEWIAHFPELISFYEKKWNFFSKECFFDAQFNIVLDVVLHNGIPAVFKCCFPNKEFKTEALSLLHYYGYGAVKLLKQDIDNGAMLLERIMLGDLLEKLESVEEATKQTASVCAKLHKSINDFSAFPTLSDWFKGFERLYAKFDDNTNLFPKNLIERAVSVSADLLSSQSDFVLLSCQGLINSGFTAGCFQKPCCLLGGQLKTVVPQII